MRFSWIDATLLQVAREAIVSEPDTEEDFTSAFELPPAPTGISDSDWSNLAEHVARADRVSRLVAHEGLASAHSAFADSPHAVEVAALVAAALEADELELDLVETLLRCRLDELIAYGDVLAVLFDLGTRDERDRVADLYEEFCARAARKKPASATWSDRVAAMRTGLAGAYVRCDRCEDAHRIFEEQHREATGDVYIALAASRTFLSAGRLRRASEWLLIGAERASALGRTAMEDKLRQKSAALRKRLG